MALSVANLSNKPVPFGGIYTPLNRSALVGLIRVMAVRNGGTGQSRAAREYTREGNGILDENTLSALNRNGMQTSNDLKNRIEAALKNAVSSSHKIEFVILSPPTDLMSVLEANPELAKGIGHIYVMGGWVEAKNASGEVELRSTYNWNMDPVSSAKLLSIKDVPMTLYSSHIIKPNFAGGSVNASNFPAIIDAIDRMQSPAMDSFKSAGLSWDTHLIEKIPVLKGVIGENAGKQFTPADPLVAVGIANPKLITSSVQVDVSLELGNVDPNRGYKVNVNENGGSNIRLVTGIDTAVFQKELLGSLREIERSYRQTKYRDNKGGAGNLCSRLFSGN